MSTSQHAQPGISAPSGEGQQLADKAASLTMPDSTAAEASNSSDPKEVPPHRSHHPQYNQKRTDPFMFGSRYLNQEDDVFEFNAWDHVETDDAYKEYAELQYAKQRESPVSDFDKGADRFNGNPAKWWDLFYKNNTANFFQNRKWLQQEFPVLAAVTQPDGGPVTILEIGAGAGNTAFPILANNRNPALKIHACDFSKKAVAVMRESKSYDPKHIQADVWDVAGDELPPKLADGTVDVAIMIFIFSALSPKQWTKAVDNVYRLLKPSGLLLFRDYGRGDLAQVRFRKGRYLEENFYIRGDGTRVYFFDKDELAHIWTGQPQSDANADGATAENRETAEPLPASEEAEPPGLSAKASRKDSPRFKVENLGVDRRLLVNRKEKIKMYRCWLQGRLKKIAGGEDAPGERP
ncbi:Methyltransferase-like protein [Zalerion maritima]|uniref:tRNA N(3)-methylcytidine methyltransferase n=1 Tax=Zalerion maritima TaxID=339359 RepID=A0AAD5WUE5_9PEZI|nr:Methyltransferase-like protein [Zalerion maritima]